jgi:hypothetical protein
MATVTLHATIKRIGKIFWLKIGNSVCWIDFQKKFQLSDYDMERFLCRIDDEWEKEEEERQENEQTD